MIMTFVGETSDRHSYQALEGSGCRRRVGMPANSRSNRRTWTIHGEEGPVGTVTLRCDTEVFSFGLRPIRPGTDLVHKASPSQL